jgi:hypothetical protein
VLFFFVQELTLMFCQSHNVASACFTSPIAHFILLSQLHDFNHSASLSRLGDDLYSFIVAFVVARLSLFQCRGFKRARRIRQVRAGLCICSRTSTIPSQDAHSNSQPNLTLIIFVFFNFARLHNINFCAGSDYIQHSFSTSSITPGHTQRIIFVQDP